VDDGSGRSSSRIKEVVMTVFDQGIRTRMTPNPVVVDPETSVPEAAKLMRQGGFRRLLVMKHGDLVGIITDRDLKQAMPSSATSLSVWEMGTLIANLKVGQVMSRDPVTVHEDDSLAKAAELMLERRIGGLPVVNGRNLVGIITTTDVLRAFVHQSAEQPQSS
jgi:acetoin utilization protein AcuB